MVVSSLLLLAIGSTASNPPIMHNDHVYIENTWNGGGHWLDTRGNGCNDNDLCVSAADSPTRVPLSGAWIIKKVQGDGQISHGDLVYIQTMYDESYLDTRGHGCNDNVLCVSTNKSPIRDNFSGVWQIQNPRGDAGGLVYTQTVHFQSMFTKGVETSWLDTRGGPCNDNKLCVSTANGVDRDNGSGGWRLTQGKWSSANESLSAELEPAALDELQV